MEFSLEHNRIQTLFFYFFASILSGLVLAISYYSPAFNFHLPLVYSADGLAVSALIKTIINTGWYLIDPHLGAPGISDLSDYPNADLASIIIIKIIALGSSNYAIVMNSFYFLTYVLTTLISLAVFEVLGVKRIFALVASLLFTFLPYHFFRGENHLFLSAYYVVPIYVFLAAKLYQRELRLTGGIILLIIFAASSGIYYALFGSYFIFLAGLLTAIEDRNKKNFLIAIVITMLIGMTLFANIAPSYIAKYKNGPNTKIAYRIGAEAEMSGLKIIQMISPVDEHRLPGLRKSKNHYNKSAPLVNENRMATLGIVGGLGFLTLLFLLLLRAERLSREIFLLSRLNIFAVLLGTIGGLGAFFAYHVTPMIRSYNRISVFIAFFSLSALFLLLQKTTRHYKTWALIILVLGLLDQIPLQKAYIDYAFINQNYSNDVEFAARIEAILPKNSMIFQLPYMYFPESPNVNHMQNYDPLRIFLHTQKLHFSYGAITGRSTADWQEKVSKMPLADMLKELQNKGFSAILIDRDGYSDNARRLEASLKKMLHQAPIVSQDQRFVLLNLR